MVVRVAFTWAKDRTHHFNRFDMQSGPAGEYVVKPSWISTLGLLTCYPSSDEDRGLGMCRCCPIRENGIKSSINPFQDIIQDVISWTTSLLPFGFFNVRNGKLQFHMQPKTTWALYPCSNVPIPNYLQTIPQIVTKVSNTWQNWNLISVKSDPSGSMNDWTHKH